MGDDKKHIDRVFQERLKDFEVVPDKMVWNNIEEKLTKKKKRSVIPIWFRYGGVAAALLLFSVIGFQFVNKKDNTIKPTIETPVVKEDINPKNEIFNNTEEVVTKTTDTPKEIHQKSQEEAYPSTTVNNSLPKMVNSSRNNVVVTSTVKEDKKGLNEKALVAQNETKIVNEKEQKVTSNLPVKENKDLQPTQETAIASNDKKITKEDIVKAIQETANKEKELIVEATKKWSVGASIAPVQFNTLKNGSPINSSLADNPKNSNTSIAYGIKINYQVNDRFTIQSGINSVDLSYNTQSVVAKVYANKLQFASSYIPNEANITSNNSISVSDRSANDVAASRSATIQLEGNIDQNFSYVEVPFEAKYALTKTKLGVNLVGGVSTYVLYKNNIILINEDGKKALGEASNLNNFNFSGNVGVDFDYKVNRKIFINMSPMFKYQLNTFSKKAGGFRPYYFGVYTGLNFRF